MIAPKRDSLPDGYVDLGTAAKMIALSLESDNILKIELQIDSTALTTDQKASLLHKILKAKFEIAFKGVN